MIKSKQTFLILLFCFSLFVSLIGFVSARETEVVYPEIPGAIRPTTTKALLPEYVRYIFSFAIFISGLAVFGSLVYGGVQYVTSAGNVAALSDAKDRIFSSFIGLTIILSSYLILTTINPQLVILTAGLDVRWGVVIYKEANCSGEFKELTVDIPDLGDFNDQVNSIEFKTAKGALDLQFYPEINYGPNEDTFFRVKSEEAIDLVGKLCLDGSILRAAGFDGRVKSIKFVWKLPGVYLVNDRDQEKFLPGDTATLGDFNDKVKKIKFNDSEEIIKYGAVLHEDQDWKGQCQVFASQGSFSGRFADFPQDTHGADWITVVPENSSLEIAPTAPFGVSSVTIFTPTTTDQAIGEGVTFCEDDDYGGKCFGPYKEERVNVGELGIDDNSITSIKIQGNYIAVLFEDANTKGKCQVFTRSDANLRDDPIGRCHCGPFGWGCGDCLSSFIIIPTR